MKRASLANALVLGLGLVAGTFAAASAQTPTQTLKIGVIAPLTGAGAPWGIAAEQGAKILAADINAKGGLDVGGTKYKIDVIAYDDQYKAADAVAAYTRLTSQDGVKHIIILGSPQAVALKQKVEDDKVVAFTTAASAKALDTSSRHMFRAINTPAEYVPPFIKWMKANMTERKVAVINPNDETGWPQTELAVKLFKENGFEVVSSELFERSMKDFQPLLTKVLATKPEIIELSGIAPASTGLIVRQARELGYKGKFSKNSGPAPQEIVDTAGKDASEGFIALLYANPGTDGYKHLASTYKAAVGQEPNQLLVTFYDAASVMLAATAKAGTVSDTAKIVAAVPQVMPMDSVQGAKLKLGGKELYGSDQQVVTVGYVGILKNGVPVVVGQF
jgi:branched-chain amino acid transport system substrate-binding protein